MSTIRSHFSSQLITSNFSPVLIVVRRFFTWTALDGVDLRFSLVLVRKANAVDRTLDDPRGVTITNVINQYALLKA
jgi:hypothetical protein